MTARSYSNRLSKRLPDGMHLPSEIVLAFDWLEGQGWLQSFQDRKKPEKFKNQFLSIYPPNEMDLPGTTDVIFNSSHVKYTEFWSTPDPNIDARIFPLARTSADGGRAALWLAPDGRQWFVHLGHDELGIISDHPVTFLIFLAMGYMEPGGFADTTRTPLEVALDYYGKSHVDDLDPESDEVEPQPSAAFQKFLQDTFDIGPFPKRASDLGIEPFCEYDDATTNDPFAKWLNAVTPPPTAEELAEVEKYSRLAEEMTGDIEKLTQNLDDPNLIKKLTDYFSSKFKT